MSEAPERIWAGNWLADVGETATWDIGEWRDEPWPTVDVVEYVRADLVKELEAKLEKTMEALTKIAGHGYGLQGLLEDGASDSEIADYWMREVGRRQAIAKATLAELKGEIDD